MEIIEVSGKIMLRYLHKIMKKEKIMKNKAQTINRFYMSVFPEEVKQYFKVEDNRIFFYKHNKEIRITSRRPTVEHQEIRIQKNNQFSIPRSFFDPADFEQVELLLDFSKVDDYKNGLGVLTMRLI